MNVKRFITATVAGALTLGLGACSAHPGTAFIVDGVEYRTSAVEKARLEAGVITGQQIPASTIVDFASRQLAAEELANENGVDLTEEMVRKELEAGVKGIELPLSDLTVKTFYTNALLNHLHQKLGNQRFAQEFLEKQAKHKVEINPRFGSVSESGTLLPPALVGVVDGAAEGPEGGVQ